MHLSWNSQSPVEHKGVTKTILLCSSLKDCFLKHGIKGNGIASFPFDKERYPDKLVLARVVGFVGALALLDNRMIAPDEDVEGAFDHVDMGHHEGGDQSEGRQGDGRDQRQHRHGLLHGQTSGDALRAGERPSKQGEKSAGDPREKKG